MHDRGTHLPDSPGDPDTRYDTLGPDRESTTGMPRWIWVSELVIAVVVLAVVAIMLIGGGGHGPSQWQH